MPCGDSFASSLSCLNLFGSGDGSLRAMFKKKTLFARSRRLRARQSPDTECLLRTRSESVVPTDEKQESRQRSSVSFAAFCDDDEKEAAAAAAAPVRQQSRFLSLPQEIRDEIYAHVFRSTRLAMGRRISCSTAVPVSEYGHHDRHHRHHHHEHDQAGGHVDITRIRPARHALALFHVCRQVHAELHIDDAWLGHVLWDFADLATMLDVLGGTSGPASPLATTAGRGRVRQVRVREGGLARTTPHRGRCGFLVGALMRLLPGLQLDRLTVLPALSCRLHGTACCYGAATGGGNGRVASHDVLAELLRTGRGWRELCYVHHDVTMLAADRRRGTTSHAAGHRRPPAHGRHRTDPGHRGHHALEAMMVSMGFWDDNEADDDVLLDRSAAPARHHSPSSTPRSPRPSSIFTAYAESKKFRLPGWRALLAARDDNADTTADTDSADSPLPTSVDVYNMHAGQALRPIRTLADVYTMRLRSDDFVVVARREDNHAATTEDTAYPYVDGDPRTLGYGTTWEELRSFLFPWDYIPETRHRYDRYTHRDEYVVGPLRHPNGEFGPRRK